MKILVFLCFQNINVELKINSVLALSIYFETTNVSDDWLKNNFRTRFENLKNVFYMANFKPGNVKMLFWLVITCLMWFRCKREFELSLQGREKEEIL